jgi:PA14 domain-containing protein
MAGCLALGLCRAQTPAPLEAPRATFGVTVVDNTGLEGRIYLLKRDSPRLPNFKKMKPKGSVYATELNVPPRNFLEGFPGVTKRLEWFAIDYSGRFWIEQPGRYRFALVSDDGAKLYIDDVEVIDNDGVHPASRRAGHADLGGGVHRIRVSYFQGPGDGVALVLEVARPGEPWRIFSTREFRPANSEDWKASGTDGAGEDIARRKK